MTRPSFISILTALLLAASFVPTSAQEPTPLLTRTEDQLIAALKSESLKDRMEACRELSVIGSRKAVAPLAALLPDPELSHMARYGLEPLPYPEVDQVFRDSLAKTEGRQLMGVMASIGVRRDSRAVRLLAEHLRNPEPEVAQAAARALGSIGTSAAARTLESALDDVSDENRLAFAEGLFRCAEQLSRGGARRAYDRLRQEDTPHQVRAGALRGAILVRGNGGYNLLRQSIQSGDLILVHAALGTAMELNGSEVTRILTGALDGRPVDIQILVLQTLGIRGDPAALPTLVDYTIAGSVEARIAAIRAMAELGSGGAVAPLVRLLDDGNTQIALAAQESLAALRGVEADAAVLALLGSTDKSERLLGIELVSRRRIMASIPTLFAAANDADDQIRAAAIRRLGEMGGVEELPPVLDQLIQSKDPSDIEATEQAVGAIVSRIDHPEEQTAEITARLPNAQSAQKAALIRILGVAGGPVALETVCAAVEDPDARATAIRTLSSWKTADAAPELLKVVRQTGDTTERTIAMRGYLGWASNQDLPAEHRLAMCRDAAALVQLPDDKKLFLGALSRIPEPESLALIVSHLDDAAVREEASAATVAVAEELLKGDDAAEVAADLVEPLRRAAGATTNRDLAQKAVALLELAREKGSS
jgi:HEAT repeat protein